MISDEIWKDIEGNEGRCQISNKGRIKYLLSNYPVKITKGSRTNKGYKIGWVIKNGKKTSRGIHCLVAEAFIPNPLNLPEVNHKNGKKWDNRVENLEWCTHAENMKHARVTKLMNPQKGEKNGNSKLTKSQVLKVIKLKGKYTQQKIADIFGITQAQVSFIHNNKSWKS
jgi:hypothetical protein